MTDRPAVPVDTFVDVMVELHLVDARRAGNTERQAMRAAVYERYGVTQQSVESTVEYYTRHPSEYADVYKTIVDRLTEASSRVQVN